MPWFIATQNDESEALRPALKDRFPVIIKVDKPVPEAYLGLPTPEMQVAARKEVEGNKSSLRPWYAYAQLRDHMEAEAAAELIWPGRGKQLVQAMKLAA